MMKLKPVVSTEEGAHERKPEDIKDSQNVCMDECSKIPSNVLFNLISYHKLWMQEKIIAVIALPRGTCTKY